MNKDSYVYENEKEKSEMEKQIMPENLFWWKYLIKETDDTEMIQNILVELFTSISIPFEKIIYSYFSNINSAYNRNHLDYKKNIHLLCFISETHIWFLYNLYKNHIGDFNEILLKGLLEREKLDECFSDQLDIVKKISESSEKEYENICKTITELEKKKAENKKNLDTKSQDVDDSGEPKQTGGKVKKKPRSRRRVGTKGGEREQKKDAGKAQSQAEKEAPAQSNEEGAKAETQLEVLEVSSEDEQLDKDDYEEKKSTEYNPEIFEEISKEYADYSKDKIKKILIKNNNHKEKTISIILKKQLKKQKRIKKHIEDKKEKDKKKYDRIKLKKEQLHFLHDDMFKDNLVYNQGYKKKLELYQLEGLLEAFYINILCCNNENNTCTLDSICKFFCLDIWDNLVDKIWEIHISHFPKILGLLNTTEISQDEMKNVYKSLLKDSINYKMFYDSDIRDYLDEIIEKYKSGWNCLLYGINTISQETESDTDSDTDSDSDSDDNKLVEWTHGDTKYWLNEETQEVYDYSKTTYIGVKKNEELILDKSNKLTEEPEEVKIEEVKKTEQPEQVKKTEQLEQIEDPDTPIDEKDSIDVVLEGGGILSNAWKLYKGVTTAHQVYTKFDRVTNKIFSVVNDSLLEADDDDVLMDDEKFDYSQFTLLSNYLKKYMESYCEDIGPEELNHCSIHKQKIHFLLDIQGLLLKDDLQVNVIELIPDSVVIELIPDSVEHKDRNQEKTGGMLPIISGTDGTPELSNFKIMENFKDIEVLDKFNFHFGGGDKPLTIDFKNQRTEIEKLFDSDKSTFPIEWWKWVNTKPVRGDLNNGIKLTIPNTMTNNQYGIPWNCRDFTVYLYICEAYPYNENDNPDGFHAYVDSHSTKNQDDHFRTGIQDTKYLAYQSINYDVESLDRGVIIPSIGERAQGYSPGEYYIFLCGARDEIRGGRNKSRWTWDGIPAPVIIKVINEVSQLKGQRPIKEDGIASLDIAGKIGDGKTPRTITTSGQDEVLNESISKEEGEVKLHQERTNVPGKDTSVKDKVDDENTKELKAQKKTSMFIKKIFNTAQKIIKNQIRKMINKTLNCQSDLEYYLRNLIDDNIFKENIFSKFNTFKDLYSSSVKLPDDKQPGEQTLPDGKQPGEHPLIEDYLDKENISLEYFTKILIDSFVNPLNDLVASEEETTNKSNLENKPRTLRNSSIVNYTICEEEGCNKKIPPENEKLHKIFHEREKYVNSQTVALDGKTMESIYKMLKQLFSEHKYLLSEMIISLLDLKIFNKLKGPDEDKPFNWMDGRTTINALSILQKQVNFNLFEIDTIDVVKNLENIYWSNIYNNQKVYTDIRIKYTNLVVNTRDTSINSISKSIKPLCKKLQVKQNKMNQFSDLVTLIKAKKNEIDLILNENNEINNKIELQKKIKLERKKQLDILIKEKERGEKELIKKQNELEKQFKEEFDKKIIQKLKDINIKMDVGEVIKKTQELLEVDVFEKADWKQKLTFCEYYLDSVEKEKITLLKKEMEIQENVKKIALLKKKAIYENKTEQYITLLNKDILYLEKQDVLLDGEYKKFMAKVEKQYVEINAIKIKDYTDTRTLEEKIIDFNKLRMKFLELIEELRNKEIQLESLNEQHFDLNELCYIMTTDVKGHYKKIIGFNGDIFEVQDSKKSTAEKEFYPKYMLVPSIIEGTTYHVVSMLLADYIPEEFYYINLNLNQAQLLNKFKNKTITKLGKTNRNVICFNDIDICLIETNESVSKRRTNYYTNLMKKKQLNQYMNKYFNDEKFDLPISPSNYLLERYHNAIVVKHDHGDLGNIFLNSLLPDIMNSVMEEEIIEGIITQENKKIQEGIAGIIQNNNTLNLTKYSVAASNVDKLYNMVRTTKNDLISKIQYNFNTLFTILELDRIYKNDCSCPKTPGYNYMKDYAQSFIVNALKVKLKECEHFSETYMINGNNKIISKLNKLWRPRNLSLYKENYSKLEKINNYIKERRTRNERLIQSTLFRLEKAFILVFDGRMNEEYHFLNLLENEQLNDKSHKFWIDSIDKISIHREPLEKKYYNKLINSLKPPERMKPDQLIPRDKSQFIINGFDIFRIIHMVYFTQEELEQYDDDYWNSGDTRTSDSFLLIKW